MKMVGYGAMGSGISARHHRPGRGRRGGGRRHKTGRHTLCHLLSGVAGFLETLGVPVQVATVFMTMCVSALALTSLDSVARIGRMSFQELFYPDSTDPASMSPVQRVLTNKYFATVITLFFGYLLTLGGYNNVWPLFGSANQLLAALVLIALAVFPENHGPHRLDPVHSHVPDADRDLHRPGAENDRSGHQFCRGNGHSSGGRPTAYRSGSAHGAGRHGRLQLLKEAVTAKKAEIRRDELSGALL